MKNIIMATRAAKESDAVAIATLGAHVFTVTFGHSVEPEELQAFLDESYTTECILKDIHDANKDVIVAEGSDGEILGFAYLTRGTTEPCVEHLENIAELQRIYVHPSTHGRGVGRVLSMRIEEMAREQGFEHLWLGVWEENNRALGAYKKWGYREVGEHDFVVGSVVQKDLIMQKEL